MSHQSLPGFREFFPDELAARTHLFEAWRRVAARYGFEEYDGPPLEPQELYTEKSGPEIVGQLYNFVDKGDREVALRPEMTPTLARMVASRANGLRKPIRWFSIAQMFRYERQQRGRLREHYQLNCDLIGEAGPLGDAEVIALLIDVVRELGLGADEVRVRVSDRRVLSALLLSAGVTEAQLPLAYATIDKQERMDRTALMAMLQGAGAGGISATVAGRVLDLSALHRLDDVAAVLAKVSGGSAALEPLRRTLGALEAMGLNDFVDVDLSIVRGLAYYTGTVFELFDAGRALRAIAGGGRYDELLGRLGGVELPAVGFAMGDVVIGELLKERGLRPALAPPIEVFIAGVTEDDLPHVLSLAHECRDAGLRTEYALTAQAVGKQLKLADARKARVAVLIGPDDRDRNEVQLKDLTAKAQRAVSRTEAVAELLAIRS
ncbi:MAG: histidine--tRNA ligase [Gemmatimonadales bacterium]|jgi:histidyl-tRNA synthetase|nr:MAG: histidine--tRNA ligase [Gemmatimonadales bacterium]